MEGIVCRPAAGGDGQEARTDTKKERDAEASPFSENTSLNVRIFFVQVPDFSGT